MPDHTRLNYFSDEPLDGIDSKAFVDHSVDSDGALHQDRTQARVMLAYRLGVAVMVSKEQDRLAGLAAFLSEPRTTETERLSRMVRGATTG